jgi:hypothetical protein
LFQIQVRFAHEEMIFGRAFANIYQLRGCSFVEIPAAGAMGCDRKHVEIVELGGFLWPQRFQSDCGIGPPAGEKITPPE